MLAFIDIAYSMVTLLYDRWAKDLLAAKAKQESEGTAGSLISCLSTTPRRDWCKTEGRGRRHSEDIEPKDAETYGVKAESLRNGCRAHG